MDQVRIKISDNTLNNLSLHQVVEHQEAPYFRVMKVTSGFLYNFYNEETDKYDDKWIFVPASTK